MIKTEIIKIGNKEFKHTFSDTKHLIKQVETNAIYDEAFDILESNYTYVETEDLVDSLDSLH